MNRILSKQEKELFRSILGTTQEGLMTSLEEFLPTVYGKDKMIITKDYIVALGDIPIGLVAHMDTVHANPVVELFHDQERNVLWSPEGLGADDRAGVYGMIEILRRGHRPTLILTTDEETGAVGAGKLISDFPQSPCELNFLIELDRRGSEDCVFYDCDNPEFEIYIEDYGFKSAWGSFSDISVICPVWGMAGVNLSIGYYNEHTKSEWLSINDMFSTIDKVCSLMENLKDEDRFRYIPTHSFLGYHDPLGTPRRESYGYGTFSTSTRDELCWECIGTFDRELMIKKNESYYCGDCYAKLFSTCIKCGDDYEDKAKVHLYCEKCREEL